MKINKTLLFAFAVLLVAGIYAIAHLKHNTQKPSQAEADSLISKSMRNGSSASNGDANVSTRHKIRGQKIRKDQELLDKYGKDRTNLSRKLSENLISVLDETLQMAEAGQAAINGRGLLGMAMPAGGIEMLGVNAKLQLTQEQQAKISKSYSDYQKRQLDKTKETVERLKKDPTPLMSLMLANDASARGEIQEKEYAQLKSQSEKDLEGVGNPVGINGLFGMGSGGSALKDETFLAEYKSELNPEQRREFDKSLASDTSTRRSSITGLMKNDISDMPKVELEQLDTQIESSKKMTTGMKNMMEGLREYQNFGQQPGQ
jgi:hypothetical protein